MNQWTPREGDAVVDLKTANRMNMIDQCGPVVRIKTITQTLIITSDGERYNRKWLRPISEDRYSARQLVRADDDRVMCVRGRIVLEKVAGVAVNLAHLPRTDPMDIVAALTQLITTANDARHGYLETLAGKTPEGDS